ncbi:GNAT family N-acetyltransferase [Nocardia cyriacigeorgica]|uniref:GNAT family N-acetyltransferase n=1 Tax=Nocardia cyriacigeorgica TaxID=135487 RepID=A0A6P1CX58_9NOCA|nr:GNAT family N-acetyltransferase [Nocardia cyriacigeorgica]MBF6426074.1 GNAT family N-acetyltransferase [Nocardia cyriacigeorgica]NEW36263.1 GNAT family N-acetyltransferase [Nocardia cyriacigeorgica]
MGTLKISKVIPEDPAVDEVIRLGKRYSHRLGMMPAGAYRDATRWGGLIDARIDGVLVGYALFRLPRNNQVMLSHLCVESRARKSGVARALIDEIRDKHSSQLGILVKCRDDYGLNPMWEALGFTVRSRTVGRSKDRNPMTVWWLDHGHADLFSFLTEPELLADEPDLLEAALDLNILMDLHTRADSASARRSRVLIADHLIGRLRLVVTNAVDRELARRPQIQRGPIKAAASHYPRRIAVANRAEDLFAQLIRASTAGEQQLSAQDKGDLWQIAEAAASGVGVLLTWDNKLRRRFVELQKAVPALSSFHVLDPDHVVTHLDKLAQASAYQPARLQNSAYDQVRASADDEHRLLEFLSKATGETYGELRDLLRRLAREQVPRWLIRTADEPAIACYAAHLDGQILRVPLMRTIGHQLSETIARQLLWLLRRVALEQGAHVIDVSDRHVGGVLTRALATDTFHHQGENWYAWVLPICGTGQDISQAANELRRLVNAGPGPLLRPELPPRAAAEIERSLWPAKLTDSALPHYVIPIRPRWSGDLLGYPIQLTTRPVELSLGREQVYYRTHDAKLTAPARVLWRVSQSPRTTAAIVGTSLLDAIEVDSPARLHAALGHYGVLDFPDLEEFAGGRPTVQALRFSDTELFDRPISIRTYDQLREQHGGPKAFYGPQRVSPELFAALYRAGAAHLQ